MDKHPSPQISTETQDAILDIELAKQQLDNNIDMLNDLLKMLIDNFDEELKQLNLAHQHQDWATIQTIAHKLKGAASYVGATRLKNTCSALELALYANEHLTANLLYHRVIEDIKNVEIAIKNR